MDSLRPREIRDYFEALSNWKWLIIVPALVITAASAIVIRLLPNVYESSTFIIVDSARPENLPGPQSTDLPRRLATIQQQVTSRTRLERLMSQHGLYADMTSRGAKMDDIVARMRSDIRVEVSAVRPEAPDAFLISFRASNPETARLIASELAGELISETKDAVQAQVSGETDLLRKRAGELGSHLAELERKSPWLLTLREDVPLVPTATAGRSTEAIRTQHMAIEGLRDQQYRLQQQLFELEKRIGEQRQIVEQQKKSSPSRDNPAVGMLLARRAELEGQRDNLLNRQELTEKHPRVLALSDQIAAVNRQIEELRLSDSAIVTQTAEARELRSLESDRARLKTELEVSTRSIARHLQNPPSNAASRASVVPVSPAARDADAARLAQDYLGIKQTYKEVQARLQDVELRLEAVDKFERFRILDPANSPELPVWPNRRLLLLVSMVVGLCAGLAIAAAGELRRLSSMHDARDVEYYTKLPLLGLIPRSMTEVERQSQARTGRLKLAISSVLALVAGVAITGLLIATELLSLIGRK